MVGTHLPGMDGTVGASQLWDEEAEELGPNYKAFPGLFLPHQTVKIL